TALNRELGLKTPAAGPWNNGQPGHSRSTLGGFMRFSRSTKFIGLAVTLAAAVALAKQPAPPPAPQSSAPQMNTFTSAAEAPAHHRQRRLDSRSGKDAALVQPHQRRAGPVLHARPRDLFPGEINVAPACPEGRGANRRACPEARRESPKGFSPASGFMPCSPR